MLVMPWDKSDVVKFVAADKNVTYTYSVLPDTDFWIVTKNGENTKCPECGKFKKAQLSVELRTKRPQKC